MLAVVGIAVLQLFGIQTASLVAVLGATSLAIGLALQGTLTNLAAGVMLLLFRPFSIGDNVEVASKSGSVWSLSLFMTELLSSNNVQIPLPNGAVWGTAILNHSTYPGSSTSRAEITFPVRAGTVAHTTGRDLLAVLHDNPDVFHEPAPTARISKVVDLSNPDAGIVDLTVAFNARNESVDMIKSVLFEAANMLVMKRDTQKGAASHQRVDAQE